MTIATRSSRGIALISTLAVSTVLLVLGLAFLAFLQRDYQFAAVQSRNQEAYYLALSGLEYARSRTGQLTRGGTIRRNVPQVNPNRYFELTLQNDGTLISTGVVQSGLLSTRRILTVRPGQSTRQYVETGI